MDLGEVLSRAWQIVWKNKALWIFGILASCSGGGGGGGGGNSGFQFSQGEIPRGLERSFNNIQDWQIALIIGAIILFVLILIVLVTFLGTIGRIGLIKGTLEAEAGAESLPFGELFNDSMPFFWRVFGLNLLVGVALAVFGIIIAGIILFLTVITVGIGLICLIPLICLLIPLTWLIQVVLEQANIALVVEDLGIRDALQRGWDVFRENLGIMVVMGLILVLGAGIISLIIAAPLIAIIVPIITGAVVGTDQAIGGGFLFAGLCFVVYLPVLLVLGGILRAYVGSAWSLTYLRLTGHAAAEPVVA
jgi:hypothetical protein